MSDSGRKTRAKYANLMATDKWHSALVTIDAVTLTHKSEQEEVYGYVIFWKTNECIQMIGWAESWYRCKFEIPFLNTNYSHFSFSVSLFKWKCSKMELIQLVERKKSKDWPQTNLFIAFVTFSTCRCQRQSQKFDFYPIGICNNFQDSIT